MSLRILSLGWKSVSLVLLVLKAIAKYSQTITTTIWRSAYASRSVQHQYSLCSRSRSHSITTMPPPVPDFSAAPPKLVLDDFIVKALSSTPPELHPFFEAFRDLYSRK